MASASLTELSEFIQVPEAVLQVPEVIETWSSGKKLLMKGLWSLPYEMRNELNLNVYYMTTVKKLLDMIVCEEYPRTYEDKLLLKLKAHDEKESFFNVTYLFSSYNFLQSLEDINPEAGIIFNLRAKFKLGFFHALVRPMPRGSNPEDWRLQGFIVL